MMATQAKYYNGCGVSGYIAQPVYQYPKDHPCRGCPYKFPTSKPSCTMGSNPSDCAWQFYKKIIIRRKDIENKK